MLPVNCKPMRSIFIVAPFALIGVISKPTRCPLFGVRFSIRPVPSKSVLRSMMFFVSSPTTFSVMNLCTTAFMPLSVSLDMYSVSAWYNSQ